MALAARGAMRQRLQADLVWGGGVEEPEGMMPGRGGVCVRWGSGPGPAVCVLGGLGVAT